MTNIDFLYHGTSERWLGQILLKGLLPRKPGTKGNYPKAISGAGRVYLTDSYAITYAGNVAKEPWRLAVLQIDAKKLDHLSFEADEDWLVEYLKRDGYVRPGKEEKRSLLRIAREDLAPNRPDLAPACLDGLGTIAHRGPIPKSAISAVALISHDTFVRTIVHGYDPVICMANRFLLSTKYKALMRWLFELDCDAIDPLTREKIQFPDREGIDILRLTS